LQGYLTEEAAARRCALDLRSPAFEAVLRRLPPDGPMLVFGLIEIEDGRLHNTAVAVRRRALVGRCRKTRLLGRERCFEPGREAAVFELGPLRFAVLICADTTDPALARRAADLGASLLVFDLPLG
jgi:predicted amidohydrolase